MNKNKDSRGGKRKGAGRPKFAEKTVVKRIPESRLNDVNALLAKVIPFTASNPASFQYAASNPAPLTAPLYISRVAAGFPSPAEDYVEDGLDLNRHFIHDPEATFFVQASGDSMNLAGIFEKTLLTVCKCCQPQNNDLVALVSQRL